MSLGIKPCPFCGGEPIYASVEQRISHPYSISFIECTQCLARGPRCDRNYTSQTVKDFWNRRIKDDINLPTDPIQTKSL